MKRPLSRGRCALLGKHTVKPRSGTRISTPTRVLIDQNPETGKMIVQTMSVTGCDRPFIVSIRACESRSLSTRTRAAAARQACIRGKRHARPVPLLNALPILNAMQTPIFCSTSVRLSAIGHNALFNLLFRIGNRYRRFVETLCRDLVGMSVVQICSPAPPPWVTQIKSRHSRCYPCVCLRASAVGDLQYLGCIPPRKSKLPGVII